VGCGPSEVRLGTATSPQITWVASLGKWPGPPLAALDGALEVAGDSLRPSKSIPPLAVDSARSTYLVNYGNFAREYDAVATVRRQFVYASFTMAEGSGKVDASGKTMTRIVDRPVLALITTGIPCQRYGPSPAPGSTSAIVPSNIGAKNVALFDGATGDLLEVVEHCGFPR
jgi:hypothetical protein